MRCRSSTYVRRGDVQVHHAFVVVHDKGQGQPLVERIWFLGNIARWGASRRRPGPRRHASSSHAADGLLLLPVLLDRRRRHGGASEELGFEVGRRLGAVQSGEEEETAQGRWCAARKVAGGGRNLPATSGGKRGSGGEVGGGDVVCCVVWVEVVGHNKTKIKLPKFPRAKILPPKSNFIWAGALSKFCLGGFSPEFCYARTPSVFLYFTF